MTPEKTTTQRNGSDLPLSTLQRDRSRGLEPLAFRPSEFFANPFGVMRRMHEDMDRMFAGALTRDGGRDGGQMQPSSWLPAVEVSERNGELCVCADLPGMKPEDVKVEVAENMLTIEGERKQEREDQQQGRWHSEREYGRFYRSISLPEGAKGDQARAEFKNGELRVLVPMEKAQEKRRQIPISTASEQQGAPSQVPS
jgi:HSP20 family protein